MLTLEQLQGVYTQLLAKENRISLWKVIEIDGGVVYDRWEVVDENFESTYSYCGETVQDAIRVYNKLQEGFNGRS